MADIPIEEHQLVQFEFDTFIIEHDPETGLWVALENGDDEAESIVIEDPSQGISMTTEVSLFGELVLTKDLLDKYKRIARGE